jgi:hypothetical protein
MLNVILSVVMVIAKTSVRVGCYFIYSSSLHRTPQPVHLPDGAEGEKRAALLQDVVREHRGANAHRLHPHRRPGLPEIRLQL